MTRSASRYTILVTIVEGRYFVRNPDCHLLVRCQFNDALFIENPETNSQSYPEILSTDPVQQTPYPIWDTELAWDIDAEVLQILRIERASLKLNCFAVNQKTKEEQSLGHIILNLPSAFESESANEHWEALTGSNAAGVRGLQPELKIAFSIDDGIPEATPTIDTHITSIESTSGSEAEHEHDAHRFDASKTGVLEGVEEEDELEEHFDEEDQEAIVPSVGNKSFHHSMDESDVEVPQSSAHSILSDMQMDIPVQVGEAMIPTDVNDSGFLQLGLGRDFFIFAITLQSTRNLDRTVQEYASSLGKSAQTVQQEIYLYYSFLGNNVATQFLTSQPESGPPIEEIELRVQSSMESMYQHFREGEKLEIHLCYQANLIGTATIPLAVILLHGTANLFHASPQFYPFHPASGIQKTKQDTLNPALIQVAMRVTRDLNTLAIPSTPAIHRSSQGSQGTAIRRGARPTIDVNASRSIASSTTSSHSPKRHDYKFSIELQSFKSLSKSLTNVSLRYNYRPFGPKCTQPPINVSRLIKTPLPDAYRSFQLCQTPEALRNQLQAPLVVEVWCQQSGTLQNAQYASGQIHLIDILDESSAVTTEGHVQRIQSSFVALLEDGITPAGEILFACALEDLGEYFDSHQSEILSTTPVHSMELHHSRGPSNDLSSGPEPQYGFHPQETAGSLVSEQQDSPVSRQQGISRFAEGYNEHERVETTSRRTSQRPPSVRLSQVRHLSQAHQNCHPHHHHPYGKPTSAAGKHHPPMDFRMALKQQLTKQVELNRQVEYDLLRRSPISSLPYSLQQSLQAEKMSEGRLWPDGSVHGGEKSGIESGDEQMGSRLKIRGLKGLDYQIQKQIIALEFRERKLMRAEEALARQQVNFQKMVDRQGHSQDTLPFVSSGQPLPGSAPSAQDYFLIQDRFRALQRQNQLLEVEFNQYQQEHPAHINMNTIRALHQTIAELESTNSKLLNDVTFSTNYKEHYKALWTHSLQEIASMRQDLQMGMEIKMMQQMSEVDQLKFMGLVRAEASHEQDQTTLHGIKTELEMFQEDTLVDHTMIPPSGPLTFGQYQKMSGY